jgi:hypothetical protein
MEGIFRCRQYMGAWRESRLSWTYLCIWREPKKERTSNGRAKKTKGKWATRKGRQEEIRSQGGIWPRASARTHHWRDWHIWWTHVPYEVEGHRRSWLSSSEASECPLPSNRDPVLRGASHMAFELHRKELSWIVLWLWHD